MVKPVPPKTDSWKEEQEPTYKTVRTDVWIEGYKKKKRGEEKEKRVKKKERIVGKKEAYKEGEKVRLQEIRAGAECWASSQQ